MAMGEGFPSRADNPTPTIVGMKANYQPFSDPLVKIDVRACLVEALAHAIDGHCGGNAVLNRLEAEACADQFLSADIRESSQFGSYPQSTACVGADGVGEVDHA